MNNILDTKIHETNDLITLPSLYSIPKSNLKHPKSSTLPMEIGPNKFLYINLELDDLQKDHLTKLLQR